MATLFDLEPPAEGGLKLNEAQRRAITHGEGPLLVIAGAGTGKTRVITERIRHLLQSDESLSGENVLGLTFTNKAAGEMKARVVRSTGERGKEVTLATFHAFCEGLLKEAAPERLMIDKVDHWILVRRNLARLKLDKYRRLADPGQFLNDFVEFFSRCQDELVSAEDYQRYADGLAAQLEAERAALDEDTLKERAEEVALQQEIARAYRASEELLREKKRVSFGSLITGAVELLERDATLRATLQNISIHSCGRISGHQYRATALVRAARQRKEKYLRRGRQRSGHLPLPRRVVRQLQTFPGAFCRMERRRRFHAFSRHPHGKLSLHAEHFARGKPGHRKNTASADFPKKVLTITPRAKRFASWNWKSKMRARWVAKEIERIHRPDGTGAISPCCTGNIIAMPW